MIKERKGFRKLHINDEVWQWKVCSSGVAVKSPSDKNHMIRWHELYSDVDNYSIENAMWDKSFHVLPSEVKQYVEKVIIK